MHLIPGKNSRAEIFVWKREHVAGFLPVAAIRLADRRFDTATAARIQREPMTVDRELVAANVSPVAVIVSPSAAWVAVNVSRKRALFAIPRADDCEPLHLWERWVDPASKEPLETFTIVTTGANELMGPIHERMPLILSPADYDAWLARDVPPVELLTTPETPDFEAVPVSSWLNSPSHDDARCMEPLASAYKGGRNQ